MRLRHVDAVLIKWSSLEIGASTRAIDRCPRVAAAAVGGIRVIGPVAKVGRFRQARWRATGRRKAVGCGRGHSADRRNVSMRSLRRSGANTKRVLGEAQADATLDAVVQTPSIQLAQCLGGMANVFKLDKAHGAVLLGSEAQPLVTPHRGEQGLELLLGRVDGQVANVEGIAGRVLIRRVDGRKVGLSIRRLLLLLLLLLLILLVLLGLRSWLLLLLLLVMLRQRLLLWILLRQLRKLMTLLWL